MDKEIIIDKLLNNKNFEQEFEVITVNCDLPISFTKDDYKTIEGIPSYSDASIIGRSGTAIAIISKNTLAIYTSENIEYPKPLNWSKQIENMKIYNKSHIIAYSLSAKNTNLNNIFIGTEYLNQITMRSIEKEVYNYVKNDNRIFLYKVTPIYKFKNDIVPIGILIEAETIDNKEKICMCRFCYNIQKGIKINYYDGSNLPIENTYGKRHFEEIKTRKTNTEDNKYQNYTINVKTKTFHLKNTCSSLYNVLPKYIQETRAYIGDIIDKEFHVCKKCTKSFTKNNLK